MESFHVTAADRIRWEAQVSHERLCDRLDKLEGALAALKGCVCPPGANLQCEAPLCPRKPIRISAS